MFKFVKQSLASLYIQYEMVTCIYMFEPWEKKLINGFMAFTFALVLFSSYVYLPSYIETFLQFVTPLPMQQQQNQAAAASSYATPILQADKISIT